MHDCTNKTLDVEESDEIQATEMRLIDKIAHQFVDPMWKLTKTLETQIEHLGSENQRLRKDKSL